MQASEDEERIDARGERAAKDSSDLTTVTSALPAALAARLITGPTAASTMGAVVKIAAFVGYNNRGFFYRKFEDDTGMKPAAWRARMKMA